MSNKTKMIIVIIALAVALVACVFTALILGGAFDKDTGNGDPTTEPTSEVADPTEGNEDPTEPSTAPTQATEPSASTDPSTTTDPTTPTTKPADKQPGDIQINIDNSKDDPTPGGNSSGSSSSGGNSSGSSSSGGASSGVISFGDLIAAAGNK